METRQADAAIAGLDVGVTTSASPRGMAKLTPIHREQATMPRSPTQEIRVLLATLLPGDRTVTHTHRHPVTVHMLEGVFTLELDGLPTVTVAAGEVYVEPAGVRMTGWNRDTSVPARMALFYVSEPDEPFADPA
jgi:quercetin dioxygenase-like cupin family protein